MLSDNFAIRDIKYTCILDDNDLINDELKNIITMENLRRKLRKKYPGLRNPAIWVETPYYLNNEFLGNKFQKNERMKMSEMKMSEIEMEKINDPVCDINIDDIFGYCDVILCDNPTENSKYNDLYQVHQLDGYRIMYGEYEMFKRLYKN